MFQRKKPVLSNTKPKLDKTKDLKTNNLATNPTTTTATYTNYAAKKSTRVTGKLTGDNDTWMEGFAVVNNNPNSKKKAGAAPSIRTYFQSRTTGQKVWDEPPSGASNIMYASEETRQMAEVQVKRLIEKNAKKCSKDKKKDKPSTDEENVNKKKSKANYKSTDHALQQAIEASLNQTASNQPSQHPPSSVTIPVKKKKSKKSQTEEDVAYIIAKKASISEHNAKLKQREQEDLMLKQAIKLSLEEQKLSKGFQEIMQLQNDDTASSWNNDSSFILPDELDDGFFSSSAFPFEQNGKMPARSDKVEMSWNGRFAISPSDTITSLKEDKYMIAELD